MTGIYIEVLESEVDEFLEILYAIDAPLISPATPPLPERIADRIIQAAVTKVDHDGEADAFEQAIEYRIANLTTMIGGSPSIFVGDLSGQRAGFKYALATYRECRKDGTI